MVQVQRISQISVGLRVTAKSLKWKLREEKLLKDFQQRIECTGQHCRKNHFRTKERDVREGMNSPVKKKIPLMRQCRREGEVEMEGCLDVSVCLPVPIDSS